MRAQDNHPPIYGRRLLAAWLVAAVGGACDSPGGGGKTAIAPEVTQDVANGDALFPQPDATTTTSGPDTTATLDTSTGTDIATTSPTDTVIPDTSPADTSASVCEQGCLTVSPQAGPAVVFTQHPATTAPPSLTGGATPSGGWRMASVDIYPYGTFAEGFEVTIHNQGQTQGRAVFEGDAMGVALHLDLRIVVDAFGETGEDTAVADVALGGCFEAAAGRIEGDLGACAVGWAAGTSPPTELGYALASQLRLALEVPPEFLIAMLPPEQQDLAAFVILGPLTLVTTLVSQ